MTRGRKPQTNEQKAAKGETRPSRQSDSVVEFPLVSESPKPPTWVKFRAGKELWKELVGKLMKQRVLTEVDLHALGHLCHLHGKLVDGYRRSVPATAAELSQLRMYFSEFGMTPSSRTRIGKGGSESPDNPFNRNGRGRK